jgi:hypothetical protein
MDNHDIQIGISRTIWNEIENATNKAKEALRGNPDIGKNPFTGEEVVLPGVQDAIVLANICKEDGIELSDRLIDAIGNTIRNTAALAAWHVGAAVDGSASFEDGVEVRVHAQDGGEISMYLHEVFFEADPRNSNE